MAEGCRALSLQMTLFVSLAPATLGVVVMTVLVDSLQWGECFWEEQWTACLGKVQHGCEDLRFKGSEVSELPTLVPGSPDLLTERLSMK